MIRPYIETGDAAQATTTAPGPVDAMARILDRLERGKRATVAELTVLRDGITALQAAPRAAAVDPWAVVARLTAWLDNHSGRSDTETALRLLKVQEEAGEVASAWIGVVGQNPRKGVTHAVGDVADELCDVIVAAMVALATLSADPAAHFDRKLAGIAALRLDTAGGES